MPQVSHGGIGGSILFLKKVIDYVPGFVIVADMSSKSAPIIQCPKCHGTGKSKLSRDMFATLLSVKRLKSAHAAEVQADLLWEGSVAAMNNRLEDLRTLNFLTRERRGKFYFYSIAKSE